MIRRLILENFMSHARTEIELADGLTVLTGPNNCGKSAVVAALQILATNGRSTHVARHGTNLCRITVITDDDHTITWERKKTTVKYTIDGEDIHRTGTSVPESLHELLRLDRVRAEAGATTFEYDIHFGEQKSPVFLLGESGSRAASFFASSSDASRLVEMQHRHRTNIRDKRAEAKQLTLESESNASRLAHFAPLDELAARVAEAERMRVDIERSDKQTDTLRETIDKLAERLETVATWNAETLVLGRLDQATTDPSEIERCEFLCKQLQRNVTQTIQCAAEIQWLDGVTESLARLDVPPSLDDTERPRRMLGDLDSATRDYQRLVRENACFETFVNAPVMLPAEECQDLVSRLGRVQIVHGNAANRCRALSPLSEVPVLDDTVSLRMVTNRLGKAREQVAYAKSLQSVFEVLQRPEEQSSTEGLSRLVNELRTRVSRVLSYRKIAETLEPIAAPADEFDAQPWRQMIGKLELLGTEVTEASLRAERSVQEVALCESEIRDYVERNPRCGTCGSMIDPNELLSTAPSTHTHDTSITQDNLVKGAAPS